MRSIIYLLCWVGVTGAACAQQTGPTAPAQPPMQSNADEMVARYPKNSIDSVDMAERALADARHARELAEVRYAAAERSCYERFFVNSCLEHAKEQRRLASERMRSIELEAAQYKRTARTAQHDRTLADKRSEREAAAAEQSPAQSGTVQQDQSSTTPTRGRSREARPVATQSARTSRVRQHEEKLERLQENEARDRVQREKNVAAYEKKVKEAQMRQKAVAEKKARKQTAATRAASESTKPGAGGR